MSENRCLRCRDPVTLCRCATVSPLRLRTHVAIVLHTKEAQKRAAPSPFALTLLSNSSLHLYGVRDAPLDLTSLHQDGARVFVLHPGEDAQLLTPELVRSSALPITLVVPDGNLRQMSRAARRIQGLQTALRIRLPESESNQFFALARALGIIESPEVGAELFELFSKSQERRQILASADNSRGRPRAALAGGDVTTLQAAREEAEADGEEAKADGEKPHLEILFEDEHLIAVNKPSGMLVHRGWGKDGPILLQVLRDQLGQHVFPVHRLDRATSGALLFARSSEVAHDLAALFDTGHVDKSYLALCRGNSLNCSKIEHRLASEKGGPSVPAVTEVKLLATFERYGLILARPLTGRTHQIRKHLKHISRPIIGDVRYGKGEHNRIFREHFGFHRLALHCASLTFKNPRTGAVLSVEAPLPPDFSNLLRRLGMAL